MVALLLTVAWLGGRGLAADAIWHDEAWTIYVAGGGPFGPLTLAKVWARTASDDPRWAPGFFLLMNGWGRLIGWEVFGLRALSLWGGLLGVAWVYRLGRDTLSPLAGGVGAFTLGASAFYSVYLHEIRPYSWIVVMVIPCVWGYWRIIGGDRGWLPVLALFAGTLGTAYIHYYAVVVPLAVAVYHLLFGPKTREWWLPVGIMAAAAVAFLPWVSVVLEAVAITTAEEGLTVYSIATPDLLHQTLNRFANGQAAQWVVLALASGWVFRQEPGVRYVWVVTVGAFGLAVIVNQFTQSLTFIRYMMMLWGLLAVVAGFGAAALARRASPGMVALLVTVWGVWGVGLMIWPGYRTTIDAPNWFISWDVLADAIDGYATENDLTLMHLPEGQARWTHEMVSRFYLTPLPGEHDLIVHEFDMDDRAYAQQARQIRAERVHYAYDPDFVPVRGWIFEQALEENYVECAEPIQDERLHLRTYWRAATSGPAVAQFGAGRFSQPLTARLLAPLPDQPGDLLTVPLMWQTPPDAPPYTYSGGLHLLDANGALVAQYDAGIPLPGERGCMLVTLALSALPPGEYTAALVAYAWETGEPLLTDDNTPTVAIGSVRR